MTTITDNLGYVWRLSSGRLVVDGDDTDPPAEGGYPCDSVEEALQLLHEFGYLGHHYLDERPAAAHDPGSA